MPIRWDTLLVNGHFADFSGAGLISQGALAIQEGRIAWLGTEATLPDKPDALANHVISLNGAWVTPGFIDSHTHLIFASNRINEFEQRLCGVSYEAIAQQGGGILSTVRATRTATEAELLHSAQLRLRQLLRSGVTTVEIKSGYGLDLDSELKMLRVARQLETLEKVRVKTTLLAAHTVPPEYKNQSDDYVNYIIETILPQAKREQLVDAIDVFCEKIAFTLEQTERLLKCAQALSIPYKIHAEQLSASGAAALGARYRALSVDHLEFLDIAGVTALAASGTVAVLLPGAFHYLREKQAPPIALLRQHDVPIAIASDLNPGTSPVVSLLVALNLACIQWNLTPQEALAGVTCHAARALGLHTELGSLTVGKIADLAVWDITQPAELCYWLGQQPLKYRLFNGKIVEEK